MKLGPVEVTKGEMLVLVVVVGGVAALVWWKGNAMLEAVGDFVTDRENPINRTAEAVYTAATGSKNAPAQDLFDATHDGARANWLGSLLDKITGVDKMLENAAAANEAATAALASAHTLGK